VVFFTLEMREGQVVERMVQQAAMCDLKNLQKETGERQREAAAVIERLRKGMRNGLWILRENRLDRMGASLSEITSAAGAPDLVVVDYIQLVDPPPGKRAENRATEIAAVTRRMKEWTAGGSVVMGLSQFNRDMEKDRRPPRLSDLRESGSIEQDADRVVAIHRPPDNEAGEPQEDDPIYLMYLIQLKLRDGPVGSLKARFVRRMTAFINFAPGPMQGDFYK